MNRQLPALARAGSGARHHAPALINNAKPIVAELRANRVRVDADFSATPFKAKIAEAEKPRVHTMLVIGGRDMEAGAVSVRLRSPSRRPACCEAKGGGRGGDFGCNQRTSGVSFVRAREHYYAS